MGIASSVTEYINNKVAIDDELVPPPTTPRPIPTYSSHVFNVTDQLNIIAHMNDVLPATPLVASWEEYEKAIFNAQLAADIWGTCVLSLLKTTPAMINNSNTTIMASLQSIKEHASKLSSDNNDNDTNNDTNNDNAQLLRDIHKLQEIITVHEVGVSKTITVIEEFNSVHLVTCVTNLFDIAKLAVSDDNYSSIVAQTFLDLGSDTGECTDYIDAPPANPDPTLILREWRALYDNIHDAREKVIQASKKANTGNYSKVITHLTTATTWWSAANTKAGALVLPF